MVLFVSRILSFFTFRILLTFYSFLLVGFYKRFIDEHISFVTNGRINSQPSAREVRLRSTVPLKPVETCIVKQKYKFKFSLRVHDMTCVVRMSSCYIAVIKRRCLTKTARCSNERF